MAHSPIRQVRLIGSTASIAADWFAHKTNIIEPAKPRSGACAGDASGRRDKIFFTSPSMKAPSVKKSRLTSVK